ncbi:TRAP transporter small permease [Faecalicatena contorta]|uniref:TRAP transporter small permease n=1 Tax=Faecalicatena contorta TaxID=39482 RepID=UPI00129D452D|nr:TRAP transporter small permease [Faecalicatena contorta]MRM86898.1 TRAP transporter small permease [Faecalicatena contorta]
MKKMLKALTTVENVIMVVTFAIMVISSFVQVVNRNFFKLPITWFDEASTYCMIYMALIGTEIGLRDGTQIAVTAVVDKFHGKGKKVVEVLSKIIVLIFSVTVLISAVKMVGTQIATGQTSAALQLPMAVPYAALVISFGMIVIVQASLVIGMIIDLLKGKNEEEEVEA